MKKLKQLRVTFLVLFFTTISFFLILTISTSTSTLLTIPTPRGPPKTCPFRISEQTITPLNNTKHFLVSAYMDQRLKGFDIRIIGIFKRKSVKPLNCSFCCNGYMSVTTPSAVKHNIDYYGFPYGTTDVMCRIPENCNASHVTLVTEPESRTEPNQLWLPIRNKEMNENVNETFQVNFTVCISTLFGDYNNVLQFAQTLEMYRLLGVERVVIYNTSCSPHLDRLLLTYSKEGFVEMVQWPIDKYLKPSHGWKISSDPGDVHYFGQIATLNECIYRSMGRSRYVLLNDIDEIIMPYQHDNLMSLMDMLQQQHPRAGVFLVENHLFPRKPFGKREVGPLPEWKGVPGFNILERIYKVDPIQAFHPYKIIMNPRKVQQTSVHNVIKAFGEVVKVPMDVCRTIHSSIKVWPKGPPFTPDHVHMDVRLWDFADQMLTRVSHTLRRAGLLTV